MKRSVGSVVLAIALTLLAAPAHAADLATVSSAAPFTAKIDSVGSVWSGSVPTKITVPSSGYSVDMQFQIQGLLPLATLSDRALGVSVEFELWSADGRRISRTTVSPYDWNPTGLNTLVSMSIPLEGAAGKHTLLIHTIYERSTTGLLSRYVDQEWTQALEVSGGLALAADGPTIDAKETITGAIDGVGNIWTAKIPTAVTLPKDGYSSRLSFPVTGLLNPAVLRDKALGVDIEFEIWTEAGRQVASDTLSSWDWNPVGSTTMADIYLYSSVLPGTYTLIIRTIYATSASGLLTRYLKSEVSKPFTIGGTAPTIAARSTPYASKSVSYTAKIASVGSIWTGDMPTEIVMPASSSSGYLTLDLQGKLPVATLTDRALGVDVEFQLWSADGRRVAWKSLSSYDWNAKGGVTQLEMYLGSDVSQGEYKLYILTTYATRTNGLLTSYLEDENVFAVTVVGGSDDPIDRGRVEAATAFTANVTGVGDVWSAKIPTKLTLSADGYSSRLEFPIEGLLPYATLADKSLGVKVEFEVWSDKGERLAYDTVSSYSWNPTASRTLVSMYLPSGGITGTHTLLIHTMYEMDTDGLLTSYLEQEVTQRIEFVGGASDEDPAPRVLSSVPVSASIAGVGKVWSANVPTAVALASSGELTFSVEGLLPKAVLRDRALGVDVEFEIWSKAGQRVASDTLNSFEWNPVGPPTLEKLYLYSSEMAPGMYSLIIRTIYSTRTSGFLTNYLKSETTQPFEVRRGQEISFSALADRALSDKSFSISSYALRSNNTAQPITLEALTPAVCTVTSFTVSLRSKGVCTLRASQAGTATFVEAAPVTRSFEIKSGAPAAIGKVSGSIGASSFDYSFDAPASDEPIIQYEVGISHTTSATASATLSSSYGGWTVLKSVKTTSFSVPFADLYRYLESQGVSLSNAAIRVAVRATSSAGTAAWSGWTYTAAASMLSSVWSRMVPRMDVTSQVANGVSIYKAERSPTTDSALTGAVSTCSWDYSTAPLGANLQNSTSFGAWNQVARTSGATIATDELLLAVDGVLGTQAQRAEIGGVRLAVICSGTAGESGQGYGAPVYLTGTELAQRIADAKDAQRKKAEADAAAAAAAKAAADKAAAAAAAKPAAKKSIICVNLKSKASKRITGTNPRCPSGWKRK